MKRIMYVLITTLIMLNLTACSINIGQSAYNKSVSDKDKAINSLNDVLEQIGSDSKYSMRQSTVDARDRLVDAMAKLSNVESNYVEFEERYDGKIGFWHPINTIKYYVCGRFYKKEISSCKALTDKRLYDYNSAKATDAFYQASVQQEKDRTLSGKVSSFFESLFGRNNNTTFQKKKSDSSFLRVAIIIIIIFLLLKLIVRKFKMRRVKSKIMRESNTCDDTRQNTTSSANGYSRLRRACDKYGYNYDDVVHKFNGDKVRAYEWIMHNR